MAGVSEKDLRRSISAILDGADLSQLSAKKVRKQLEEEHDEDFSDRKKEIDKILMQMIEEKEKNEEENGEPESDSDQSEIDSDDEPEPPKKKVKKQVQPTKPPKKKVKPPPKASPVRMDSDSDSEELDDEKLAKKLQEEESGRRSRHRSVKKVATPKVKRKKIERKNSGTSVYAKKCVLSADLARVVGTDKLARKDVVKKMWEIIKERNLQDPKNKQFMLCDDQLMPIFGLKRVRTFGMLKYLKNHMKDVADICT